MSVIAVEHLTRRFPGETRPAVDDVSFTVDPGEFLVLIGPSGCGKTTLLKMINRLYEPTSGTIAVDGTDATAIPATDLRRRIGYVIQQTGLFPHFTIAQNIGVVPTLLGWDKPRIAARVVELLDLIGLPQEYAERRPRQLSGGQQQRVGVARALAADPKILLMDEPFGALDAITRTRLQDELLQIQQRLKKTILFVTHDMEEALKLADRVLVMRTGKLVQLATPLQLMTHPADTFVADLVGAGDVLRTLGLLRVGEAMANGASAANGVAIAASASLRDAIGMLLTSSDRLAVQNDSGAIVGSVGFAEVRAALSGSDSLN